MITAPALTAARVTRLAKAAAPELRWSSEKGVRGILVRLWNAAEEGDRTELRLLNEARRLINATELSATVVSLRSRRGVPQFRILVTSEAQESAAIQEQADKRAKALEDARAEVTAAEAARAKVEELETTCTKCGQRVSMIGSVEFREDGGVDHGYDCTAAEPVVELSEQAQRTIAEMAAARGEEPAEHRAFRERMEATAADRQRAEGERNARLMAHRTAMREADRTGLVTAPREDTGYPPYTTAEAVELAHAGLSLLSDHGGSYAHTVRQGGHLGRVLGRVQCITDEEDLTTVRFGAYRPDGSRVGIADSRPEAARLLRPAAEASTDELPFVDVIARHGKPIYVACAADGTAVSEHPSRALAEHAVRHLPPVELTPAVVTLTNPELWG